MALYYDNFETYGTVTTTPFGSFTGGGATIVTGTNYVTTGSHAMHVISNSTTAIFTTGGLFSSNSVWVAFQLSDTGVGMDPGNLLSYENGTSFPTHVFQLYAESDYTLSVRCDGKFGGNSGNFNVHRGGWYMMQVNTTIFDAAGLVACAYDVGMEGTSIMSGTMTSTISTTNTPSHTAQWDHIIFGNVAYYDEFTLDTQTSIGVYPNPGLPKGRVSTALIEYVRLNSDANVRASTGLIELVLSQHGWEVREA